MTSGTEVVEAVLNRISEKGSGLRAVMAYAGSAFILCIGEKDWSRCVEVRWENDRLFLDPWIYLLRDNGESIGSFCMESAIEKFPHLKSIRLSELIALGKEDGIKDLFATEKAHHNKRLRSPWDSK